MRCLKGPVSYCILSVCVECRCVEVDSSTYSYNECEKHEILLEERTRIVALRGKWV